MNILLTVHNEEKRVDSFDFDEWIRAVRFMEVMASAAKMGGIIFILWCPLGFPVCSEVSPGGGDSWIGEDIEERGIER